MSSDFETIATKSAAEIGRGIEAGAIDPLSLTEFYLERAAARPDIYVRTTPDRARREAAAARGRAAAGLRRHPLDGVPISWKDLFDFQGEPTEGGSHLLTGRVAETDADVVRRAAQAGLVALGKTHLSELAFSGLGYNPMTATPPNVFDATRLPGGSSSGAATSVAFGTAAAGIGSDTGGSVRIPSAWNGLVGLKTTSGAIPLDGALPLAPSLDTVGPLTRTVEDAALLYGLLADRPTPDLSGASVAGRRFLVGETVMFDEIEPEIAVAFDAAIETLRAAGAIVERGPVPEFSDVLDASFAAGGVVTSEAYGVWRETIEAAPDKMFPMILARFRSGAGFDAADAFAARRRIAEIGRSYVARTATYDAVLCPTNPSRPPVTAEVAADEALYTRVNLLALRNTRIGNLLGICALALPAGMAAPGAPCSLTAIAPPFDEARLLRIGAGIERALAA